MPRASLASLKSREICDVVKTAARLLTTRFLTTGVTLGLGRRRLIWSSASWAQAYQAASLPEKAAAHAAYLEVLGRRRPEEVLADMEAQAGSPAAATNPAVVVHYMRALVKTGRCEHRGGGADWELRDLRARPFNNW